MNSRHQHRDIEEAVHAVAPTSSNNRHLTLQQQQLDGDPFLRRSSCAVSSHDTEMTTTIPDLLGSSIRSGNYTGTADADASVAARPRGLLAVPTTTVAGKLAPAAEPRLLHPILLKIPLHIRFGFNGLLCNVLFMVVYNYAVTMFEHRVAVPTIYSIVYFVFIPLGHAFVSLLVFGWPERYVASLMSNFPIGLSAIAIGGLLTGYLDSIHWSELVDEFIRDYFTFSKMPPRLTADGVDGESQFWSSLLVLIVTSIWTYVLSIYINSIPTKSAKKEL